MRKLPTELIRFSSEKGNLKSKTSLGKTIFQEAMLEGNMETYFPLRYFLTKNIKANNF